MQRSGCSPELCVHACLCKQVCSSVHTTKGHLNASPTERAGSMNPRQQPGEPIVEKGCLSRDKKGRGGQDDTCGRGKRICTRHKLLSHYRRRLPPAASRGRRVCACTRVQSRARLTLSCPARRRSARHSYRDIDSPPSLPEQDRSSICSAHSRSTVNVF